MSLKPRVLSFIVEGQSIKKDENCDFNGLVAGTKGYYAAKFSFDRIWKDYKKIACFKTTKVTKYVPIMGATCDIPDEIVESMMYRVSVIGVLDETKIPTTEVAVRQRRGA